VRLARAREEHPDAIGHIHTITPPSPPAPPQKPSAYERLVKRLEALALDDDVSIKGLDIDLSNISDDDEFEIDFEDDL